MPCSDPNDAIWTICTDANTKYTKNATYVGVVAEYHGGGIIGLKGDTVAPIWDYVMYLERWDPNKKEWVWEGTQEGYFRYRTPVKKFPLAGKKAGKYRIEFNYRAKQNPQRYRGTEYTYPFLVER